MFYYIIFWRINFFFLYGLYPIMWLIFTHLKFLAIFPAYILAILLLIHKVIKKMRFDWSMKEMGKDEIFVELPTIIMKYSRSAGTLDW